MQILHGDDLTASRDQLQKIISEAKLKNLEVIQIDGKKCTLTDIKQALESQSLFGQDKLVIVENLFSRQDSNQKKQILKYLQISASDRRDVSMKRLYIWESKQISATQLKKFPKNSHHQFQLPTVIFQFLDSFSPQNPSQNLKLLNQVLSTQPPEMLFGILIKRLRYLTVGKNSPQTLSHFKELRDWQQKKILTQANKFSTQQLYNLNQNLLKIDYSIKTGRTNITLKSHLEILFTNL